MISAARNIRDNAEALVKMPLRHVYDALRNPRPDITAMLNQIRVARALDPSRYPALKSQLPYFVCAIFNPPYRRSANFAYTEYFIIDIDHVSEQGLTIQSLRQRISADSHTLLCFISPGGDGLKVVMQLSENATTQALQSILPNVCRNFCTTIRYRTSRRRQDLRCHARLLHECRSRSILQSNG